MLTAMATWTPVIIALASGGLLGAILNGIVGQRNSANTRDNNVATQLHNLIDQIQEERMAEREEWRLRQQAQSDTLQRLSMKLDAALDALDAAERHISNQFPPPPPERPYILRNSGF